MVSFIKSSGAILSYTVSYFLVDAFTSESVSMTLVVAVKGDREESHPNEARPRQTTSNGAW